MRKYLSLLIAAAMLSSAAIPVFAEEEEAYESYDEFVEAQDYEEASYDKEDTSLTFDDGTVTNPIDSTPAKQVGTTQEEIMYSASIDSTREFFLSYDFCYDNENGYIETPSDAKNDRVGLTMSYSEGKLRTQTGSNSYQVLGDLAIGEWYTAEIFGKTGMGAAYTTFRLYSYVDGVKTLVQETPNLNFRNLSNNGRHFSYINGHDISIDNVKLIQEYPDEIAVTAGLEEISAGSSTSLDYTMLRKGSEMTKYDITWSIYDENNENPIEDENFMLTAGGLLSAGITTPDMVITIRATAEFEGKELYGTKQIKINAVSTENEKFDTIEVIGDAEVKAGTSSEYTYKATKNGEDVTASLTDGDVVWGIYDALGIQKNGNANIKIENGVLTVADGVIPQTITVKALSASGTVSGGAAVAIAWSDNQKEDVLTSNACETELANTVLVESLDGSRAYQTTDNVDFVFGDTADYTATELDIKFTNNNGAGITLKRADGTENSNIRINSESISQQTSGSNWTVIIPGADLEAWYHIEFLYAPGMQSGYNIYKYNADGTMELAGSMQDCNRRNDKNYGKLTVSANVTVDNIKITKAMANEVSITAPGQYIFAGETAQFTATAARGNLPLKNAAGLTWKVLDAEKLPITDGSVTINESGLVTVDAMAPAQTITVRVASANGAYADADIIIQVAEVFTVKNVGINEEGDKIVRLYVDKNFFYEDDVTFVIAIKDAEGTLKAVKVINTFGERLTIGLNEITTDLILPADFDPDTDKIETMVWTTL